MRVCLLIRAARVRKAAAVPLVDVLRVGAGVAERLVAALARVRLLPGVQPHVLRQVVTLLERLDARLIVAAVRARGLIGCYMQGLFDH